MSKKFNVWNFHFIDTYKYLVPIEAYFKAEFPDEEFSESEREKIISELVGAFKSAGWEGDGKLTVIWLPPFIQGAQDDTYGDVIFHVKQKNNGTSFLASEKDFSHIFQNAEKIV